MTSQSLYDLYLDVVDDFYGEGMVRDSLLGYYWSGVPHFHFGPYYVYKYATSYAAASHLVNGILQAEGTERQQAAERLLNLLRAGDSDYPMELLRKAGVDMSDIQTYQAVVDLTVDLVDRLKAALAEL